MKGLRLKARSPRDDLDLGLVYGHITSKGLDWPNVAYVPRAYQILQPWP